MLFKVLEFKPENITFKHNRLEITDSTVYHQLTNKIRDNNWVVKSSIESGREDFIQVETKLKEKTKKNESYSAAKILKSDSDEDQVVGKRAAEKMWDPRAFKIDFLEEQMNMMKRLKKNLIEEILDTSFEPSTENIPTFCDHSFTNNKLRRIKHCELNIQCRVQRNYELKELQEDHKSRIGLTKINVELQLHGHPMMRDKMDVKQRRKELIDHYVHYHNPSK